jgi:hypothetical protein
VRAVTNYPRSSNTRVPLWGLRFIVVGGLDDAARDYAPGNPVACLATSTAVQLSNYLRKNGDKELARRILTAVEEARRYTRNAISHATEIGAAHRGLRGWWRRRQNSA